VFSGSFEIFGGLASQSALYTLWRCTPIFGFTDTEYIRSNTQRSQCVVCEKCGLEVYTSSDLEQKRAALKGSRSRRASEAKTATAAAVRIGEVGLME
jgi:hypothetical protein